MTQISTNEDYILGRLAEGLFKTRVSHPQSIINYDQVITEAKRQAVLPLVFDKCDDVPDKYRNKVRNLCISNYANNVRVHDVHTLVHSILTDAGVPYVVLKGCVSAYYYPEPMKRTMGDVDVLVADADLDAAGKALETQGFKPWDEKHISHVVYNKGNASVELHFAPAGMPAGKAGDIMRGYMKDIWDISFLYGGEMGQMRMPDALHHGLILIMHMYHHLTGEGLGLRHMCDWACFVDRVGDEVFRELFEEKLKAVGLWHFAQVMTLVCVKYMGLPEQKWAEAEIGCGELETAPDGGGCSELKNDDTSELVDELMRDILDSGNFGCKDRARAWEAYLISDRGKSGVGGKTKLGQFVYNVNETIYLKKPVCHKWRILMPFAWAYYGGRQAVLAAQGKREAFRPVEAGWEAEKRRRIYKKLGMGE